MNSNRRKFLKNTTIGGIGLAISPALSYGKTTVDENQEPIVQNQYYMGGYAAPKLDKVRCAFIGVGPRGAGHVRRFSVVKEVEVVAICDLFEDLARKSADICKKNGKGKRHKNVALYYGGENEWRKMLEEQRPDAVIISTHWKPHALMSIESMKAGAHAFVEVPLALTIQEMWDIVNTSEITRKHCMMLENVNYGREELIYLNMCRKGVIGELLHGEAAYIHELRAQMLKQDRGMGVWRTQNYADRNGNLYPTHGLGPVAQYMNLSRGEDNFRRITSFSSPAIGRKQYAAKNLKPDNKWNQTEFKGGDINTSIIKTTLGRTIMVQWDETTPRPYSRFNLIQGTKGVLAGFPNRIALENEDYHHWIEGEQLEAIFEKYEHPLYKRLGAVAKKIGGHGGMDFMMTYRIIECLRKGLPLDQNVYEGCFWSAVAPLSEASVASDGAPQNFPDFTRGQWKTTQPLDIIS